MIVCFSSRFNSLKFAFVKEILYPRKVASRVAAAAAAVVVVVVVVVVFFLRLILESTVLDGSP